MANNYEPPKKLLKKHHKLCEDYCNVSDFDPIKIDIMEKRIEGNIPVRERRNEDPRRIHRRRPPTWQKGYRHYLDPLPGEQGQAARKARGPHGRQEAAAGVAIALAILVRSLAMGALRHGQPPEQQDYVDG